ncbi:hypothetical protein TIFTF001_016786 [Ficus carica]|uniref:Uncharacterized protein n=1 Tax=Ficus carica TaxID=3494 RepID=A0AA88D7P2_FICCA|nr:hypothetical protein TIFTF001_016786 [Ficus carica]
MRSIKSGLHTVELSWWVSLLSLLKGLGLRSDEAGFPFAYSDDIPHEGHT